MQDPVYFPGEADRSPKQAVWMKAIGRLPDDPKLQTYYLYLAVKGHLLQELGRGREAADAFRAALDCHCSEPERRFLQKKLSAIGH